MQFTQHIPNQNIEYQEIVHDIRSQLATIKLCSEYVSSNSILEILDSSIAQIEYILTEFEDEAEINIMQYLSEILRGYRTIYPEYTFDINFKNAKNCALKISKAGLTRIITNIINNSLEAGQKQKITNIAIQIGIEEINLITAVKKLEISIRDNCGGISSNITDDVFAKGITDNQDRKSSGLGLFIVKKLVRTQLSGQVHLENRPGEGVTITVTIPV